MHSELENEFKILKEIQQINELKIDFPEDINNWNNENFIKKSKEKLAKKIEGKFDLIEFHYMKTIFNPEISVILQLFQNFDFNETCIFLNKDVKYIGINLRVIDQNICVVYLVFTK